MGILWAHTSAIGCIVLKDYDLDEFVIVIDRHSGMHQGCCAPVTTTQALRSDSQLGNQAKPWKPHKGGSHANLSGLSTSL